MAQHFLQWPESPGQILFNLPLLGLFSTDAGLSETLEARHNARRLGAPSLQVACMLCFPG